MSKQKIENKLIKSIKKNFVNGYMISNHFLVRMVLSNKSIRKCARNLFDCKSEE